MSNRLKIMEPTDKFYQNHVTFTSTEDIKSLVSSELSGLGINYFTFDRTYNDGSHVKLTTAGAWIEHYYREKLYNACIFEIDHKLFAKGYLFWSWLNREPLYSAASLFDIDHGFTIIQPQEDCCDFFNFGTSRNNPISKHTLLSQMENFYHFVSLFYDKAQRIINEAARTRFILPIKSQTEIYFDQLRDIHKPKSIKSIQRLYLGEKFENVYLTNKEIQILFHLKDGAHVPEVAKKLDMSIRTAETHVNHIKEKLKCNTMFELGYATNSLRIPYIFSNQ